MKCELNWKTVDILESKVQWPENLFRSRPRWNVAIQKGIARVIVSKATHKDFNWRVEVQVNNKKEWFLLNWLKS